VFGAGYNHPRYRAVARALPTKLVQSLHAGRGFHLDQVPLVGANWIQDVCAGEAAGCCWKSPHDLTRRTGIADSIFLTILNSCGGTFKSFKMKGTLDRLKIVVDNEAVALVATGLFPEENADIVPCDAERLCCFPQRFKRFCPRKLLVNRDEGLVRCLGCLQGINQLLMISRPVQRLRFTSPRSNGSRQKMVRTRQDW
jgi:hypothetical protein